MANFESVKMTNPYGIEDTVLKLSIDSEQNSYRLSNLITEPDSYVFVIWHKTNTPCTISINVFGEIITSESNSQWTKVVKVKKVSDVSNKNIDITPPINSTTFFYEAYLSRGTIDTSWSPAPEDIDDNIESVKSEFTQTAEEIKMSVKNIKGDVSNLNIQVGKIEQSVADNKGNISSLTTTIDGINATVKKQGESISSIDQKADKISQQVTSVKSELNSKIELTAGEISQKVDDVRADLSSEIKQTSDKISQTVTDMNKNLSTRIDQTAKDIELNASKTEELQNNVSSIYEGNLITNGFGTMKNNTNFTSWVYDGANKYDTYPSFKYTRSTSSGVGINDMKIPIDISKSYEFDMALKSIGSNNKLYLGFDEYDIDGNYIKPSMCMGFSNSTTTLVKDLKKGDTVVYLKSTSGFTQTSSTYQLGLIFWDYKDSTGYKYPVGVYSRNSTLNLYDWSGVNKTNNTITLKQPWDGLTHTVGTSVSQTNDAGHKYFSYKGSVAPTEWTRTNHKIAGIQSLYSFNYNSFNQATKYIKFMLYHNYAQSDNQEKTTILSKVSFVESTLKNNLQNNYYNKTETDAKLKVQSDNITANVKKEVTTIKNDLDQNYYNKTETDSKFKIQSDSINLKVEKVEETAQSTAEDLTNYINLNKKELENLQSQIDGSIMTWFYSYVPTNSNKPAVDWNTVDLKNNHLGDLFYDTTTGYCYRWQVQSNQYSWSRVTDVDVTKALSDAAKAQDTADAKRRVFVTTPKPPYEVGDLWVQGTSGDIMRCKTAKTSSQSYSSSDWDKASKYTDDTTANGVKNDLKNNYYTKTQTDAQIKVSSDSITSTVKKEITTQIGNIDIGGRNLLLNTGFNTFNHWIKSSNTKSLQMVNGWCEVTIGGTWSGFVQEFIPEKNVEYIVSYEAYLVDTVAETAVLETDFGTPDQNQTINKTPAKYSLKLKYPSTSLNGKIDFMLSNNEVGKKWRIRNIKLEKGNKATDWTPAPEDMATADSLSDVNNSLTDVTNGLQSDINSTNKNLQDIQNSQNEVYEIVSQNKSQISSLTQRAEGFTMDFKTVNETVKQINNQFVTERDERYKYIKFIDGEIWLGKEVPIGEDDFKLVIKNDRISFLQNKAEVAYMSNNKLYVTDIHVTNSLQLGRFIFSARSNGNVGIRWINQ